MKKEVFDELLETGHAKILLRVAAKHPEAVLDVVRERKSRAS